MKAINAFLGLILFGIISMAVGTGAANFFGAGSTASWAVAFGGISIAMSYITPEGVLKSSADLSAITSYIGKVKKELIVTLVNGLDVAKDVTVWPGMKDKVLLPKLTVDGIAKPFSSTFTGTADKLVYTDREFQVQKGKGELLLDPNEYKQSYFSEMLEAGTGDKKKIPFAKFTMQKVIESFGNELNTSTVYLGEHDASGSGAADIADGFGTQLAALITASKVTPTATGAISNSNAVAAFETLYKALPLPYKNVNTLAYCSFDVFYKYLEDYRSKYGTHTAGDDFMQMYIKLSGKRCKLHPVSWMGNSQRIIITPKANMIMGTDLLSDFNDIRTLERMYTLEMSIAMTIGFTFQDLNAMVVNDQA